MNVSIWDFSRVPLTPAWLAIVVDETTSCSSSASNTLHDKTLKIIQKKKKHVNIIEIIILLFYLRNKRALTVRLANGESQWPAAVLDGSIFEFLKGNYAWWWW